MSPPKKRGALSESSTTQIYLQNLRVLMDTRSRPIKYLSTSAQTQRLFSGLRRKVLEVASYRGVRLTEVAFDKNRLMDIYGGDVVAVCLVQLTICCYLDECRDEESVKNKPHVKRELDRVLVMTLSAMLEQHPEQLDEREVNRWIRSLRPQELACPTL